jgi:hypothetical protein
LIESLSAEIISKYFGNYKFGRLNTAKVFNFDLYSSPKYQELFSVDSFVSRTDFALEIIYNNLRDKALKDRKEYDLLMSQGVPISDIGVDFLAEQLIKLPAPSEGLEVENSKDELSWITKTELIYNISINKLIQIKRNPEFFANKLSTLELPHITDSIETP